MRKIIVVTLLLMLLMPVPVSGAQVPFAFASADQVAEAVWLVREKGGLYMYFVSAGRHADALSIVDDPTSVGAMGVVARGECQSREGPGSSFIICQAKGRPRPLAPGDFEFDPLLASARMRLEAKGFVHEVTWTGRGRVPSYGFEAQGDDEWVRIGGGIYREAKAEGEVLGRSFAARGAGSRRSFAYLATGAEGFAAHGLPLPRRASGKKVHVTWKLRSPHVVIRSPLSLRPGRWDEQFGSGRKYALRLLSGV